MSDGLTEKYRRAKLDEDIAKLEAEVFGLPGTSDSAEQEEIVLDDNEVVSPDQSSEGDTKLTDDVFTKETADEDTRPSDSDELAKLRKDLADSIHRYNRFKGSTDQTLFNLRTENANLAKRLKDAEAKVLKLSEELDAKPVMSDEAEDIFGEEGSQIIKSLKAEIAELKRQKESSSDDLDDIAKTNTSANESTFYERLEELVPDLEKMNSDPEFNNWLRQPNEYGIERLTVLRSDQARYDYVRVAEFFKEYKRIAKGKKSKTPVRDSIDEHRGPTGKQSDAAQDLQNREKEGYIKQSEINKFQREVNSGKYKYDSAYPEAMEARIFKAMHEDKIIADEHPILI